MATTAIDAIILFQILSMLASFKLLPPNTAPRLGFHLHGAPLAGFSLSFVAAQPFHDLSAAHIVDVATVNAALAVRRDLGVQI
jgi:hypothetical protein